MGEHFESAVTLALAELLDKATPAPWQSGTGNGIHQPNGMCVALTYQEPHGQRHADAILIAALRNAAPALLSELAEARRKIAAVERLIAAHGAGTDNYVMTNALRAALDPS